MAQELTFSSLVWRNASYPQALHGNEFERPQQRHEQTPAGLAES